MKNNIFFTIIAVFFIITLWWRDVARESESGQHNYITYTGVQIGITMLITSEVLFFFGFFWSYLWYILQTQISTGLNWPPSNLIAFDPYGVPFLNSLILLSSGVTVTYAHHIISKNHKETIKGLILTISLGLVFTLLQAYEYKNAIFSMSDASFGSIFFTITGFHGVHVIAGTIILAVSIKRAFKGVLRKERHNNLILSIWYWHFVDVVWLALYSILYWWTAL